MSQRDLIEAFVERQYVSDLGSPRDNVERLFASDLVYHAGADTLDREDLVAIGRAVRATRRQARSFDLSDWEEQAGTVRWRLVATLPAMGPDGADLVQDSVVTAMFGPDGLVHEVWSRDASSNDP